MKQFNEKPSKYKNLGADIIGAQRHNFDTYESPEQVEAKAKAKRSKNNLKEIKDIAINSINESNYMDIILNYETAKTYINMGFSGEVTPDNLIPLRDFLRAQRGQIENSEYNKQVSRYNRLRNLLWRLKYRVSSDNWAEYFKAKAKNSFIEHNGIKRPWMLTDSFNPASVDNLINKLDAVQFGNSLPEKEREYCMHNLSISIDMLQKYFNFNFKTIGFSFGARGNAGSIAHYQDSLKVLAFNRGWDGALIHELGHAIDYSLGLPSKALPIEIKQKYRDQLRAADVPNMHYYMKNVEIFARLFEVYCIELMPEITSFMQDTFCSSVMPKLDDESREFMRESIKTLIKGENQ